LISPARWKSRISPVFQMFNRTLNSKAWWKMENVNICMCAAHLHCFVFVRALSPLLPLPRTCWVWWKLSLCFQHGSQQRLRTGSCRPDEVSTPRKTGSKLWSFWIYGSYFMINPPTLIFLSKETLLIKTSTLSIYFLKIENLWLSSNIIYFTTV